MSQKSKAQHASQKESPHPIDTHVGKRLRLKRTMAGISQDALGKKIGVTFQQIQKYERGINRIGASRLYTFSKILSVSPSYFFDGYSDPEEEYSEYEFAEGAAAFETEPLFENKETISVIQTYYAIPSKEIRKKVLSLIKALSNDEKPENKNS